MANEMKVFKFEGLEVRTDKGKAVPELVHDYHPYKDNENVVFKVRYLQNGESSKYLILNAGNGARYDYMGIFRDKVLDIKGIGAIPKGRKTPVEIKTAEDFLLWPQTSEMNSLLLDVALHIMNGSELTEEEIKNSN